MKAPDELLRPRDDDAWIVAGEITADAAFASRRRPETPTWLLLLTRGGAGRVEAGGDAERLNAGDLVLVPPRSGDSMWSTAAPPWAFLWFHVRPRPAWIEWLDWPASPSGLQRLRLAANDPIATRLVDVHQFLASAHRRRDSLAANAMEEALLWCDARRERAADVAPPPDDRMAGVAAWMCRNLARSVTLDAMAEFAGLSPSRFAHRFRDEVGVAPLRFLDRQRMRRAAELLAVTQLSVAQVAAEIGMRDPGHFVARFRRASGATPEQFRRRSRDVGSPQRDALPSS